MAKAKLKPSALRLWKLDWALLIAGLALFVSAAQLVVTVPILSQKLFAPELVVTVEKVTGKDESIVGSFKIENRGETPATSVEVGIITVMGDSFHVFPSGAHDVVNKYPEQVLFINRTLNFDRILPGEEFSVLVSSLHRKKSETEAANRMLKAMGVKSMPNVSYVRSAEGRGKIEQAKGAPLVTKTRTVK